MLKDINYKFEFKDNWPQSVTVSQFLYNNENILALHQQSIYVMNIQQSMLLIFITKYQLYRCSTAVLHATSCILLQYVTFRFQEKQNSVSIELIKSQIKF